jgi:ribonuclease E
MARIGQLQPVLATPQPSAEALFDADVAFSADVADFEERAVGESVETEQASIEDSPRAAEAEAAPAKSGERRRPRRSAKAREAPTASEVAQEIVRESGEQAPELALETSAGGEATDADGETVAAPRRSRRAPPARAPRRSIASGAEATALEAEASPPEAQDAAAESAGAPLFERAPDGDALQEQRRASPIETAEPVRNLEPARNGPLPESESPSQHQDPARPKRSGWWQRAKASLGR